MNIPFFSDIDLKNNKIINSANPINDNDLVNKLFVDTSIETAKEAINQSILIAKNETIEYVDTQIADINTNFSTNVEQILQTNIIDDILSSDSTKALSANMGHYLSTLIDDMNNLITTTTENINVYSTNNQIEIGRYDNKILYRLVIEQVIGPQPSQDIQIDLSNIINNPIKIVNIYGTYKLPTTMGDTILYDTYFIQNNKPDSLSNNGVYIEKFNNEEKKLYISLGNSIIETQQEEITLTFVLEYYYEII